MAQRFFETNEEAARFAENRKRKFPPPGWRVILFRGGYGTGIARRPKKSGKRDLRHFGVVWFKVKK